MKKWLIIAVIVVVVALGGWFAFKRYGSTQAEAASSNFQTVPAENGDLTATVGATGVVRANQEAVINWQTSGTVEAVNVTVGDPVTAGDELAHLEKTSLSQSVIQAQGELVNAKKALDDLLNSQLQPTQALKAVEDARQALTDAQDPELSQAKAQEALATAQKAVEDAQNQLRWANSPADQTNIDEAKAQVTLARDRLNKAQENFAPYANKPENSVNRAQAQSALSQAQQQYDAAVRNLNSLQGTASNTQVGVLEANLATAKAQLAEAQRGWERVKDGPNQADIAVLQAQLEDAQRTYERVKNGADPDDVAAAEARVTAAQATVNQAFLTAPFDGVATEVISKPGDQVAPGSPAFRIDDLSHLLVDVQVSEVDINRIKTGQDVSMTFDAILGKEYQGTVREVALVGTTSQGVVDFTVTVELTNPDEDVRPGMTAAVNIVVQKLHDVLLVPNRAVRLRDGKRVVYVLRNSTTPEPVNITLGASSDTMSEVTGGELKKGDMIVLNPPVVFEHSGGGGGGFMGQ